MNNCIQCTFHDFVTLFSHALPWISLPPLSATVAIIKELVFKATCFQANRLRNPTNLFVPVDEAVVQAFQILAQMTPDQLQLVLDPVKGEVAWTV